MPFLLQLTRQPLFFRETNPQPRKHTLWQATSDFTSGQASLHRYSPFEMSWLSSTYQWVNFGLCFTSNGSKE